MFEDKIVNLQDDYQAVQDQMTAEITILKGKLDSLEDFRVVILVQFSELALRHCVYEKDTSGVALSRDYCLAYH